jgi:hypothetical protein
MIHYINDAKIKEVKVFRKAYPKIYTFIEQHVRGKAKVLTEYKRFLKAKNTLTHEQNVKLGYHADEVSSPTFGTKVFYKTPKYPDFVNLGYAAVFQYIYDHKVKH